MSKGRFLVMGTLALLIFLSMNDWIELDEYRNYAFSLAALIFSFSTIFDTYQDSNRKEEKIRFGFVTVAFIVATVVPILKDKRLIDWLMRTFSSNTLLLMTIFVTIASQCSMELKIKEIQIHKGDNKNG